MSDTRKRLRRALWSRRFVASVALVAAVLEFVLLGDELALLMHGTRTSLSIGAIAGPIAVAIGTVEGTAAGYWGGRAEELLVGVTNIVITLPSLIVLILISVALDSRSLVVMGIIIGLTSWPWTARAVRAQASSLRAREHIDAARLSGTSDASIMLHDVIPYMLSYLGMAFTLQLAGAVLAEAGLSMLGLGPSGTISLGLLLQWALL